MACKEEAATIKEVKGSNKMLEYDRPLGMERVGKGPSKWKFGIHSSNVGPLKRKVMDLRRVCQVQAKNSNLIGIEKKIAL